MPAARLRTPPAAGKKRPPSKPDRPQVLPPPRDPHQLGQPSKFTPERVQRILQAATAGAVSNDLIARYAGVDEVTVINWRNRGEGLKRALGERAEDDAARRRLPLLDQAYLDFFERFEKARADAEVLSIGVIRSATARNWQAHAHWLSLRNPGLYVRKQRIEHSGPDGGPILTSAITDEDRRRRRDKLRRVLNDSHRAKE